MGQRLLGRALPGTLALAAGAALPFAFAPYHWFGLALLAPAVLLAQWRSASPRQALWRGWLFGVGMFGVGVSWVHVSIHHYGNTPLFLSIPLTVLFAAGLALFVALYGYALKRVIPSATPVFSIATFPATWVLFEWWRGWFLTGFPWLYLGYSQVDTPLAGLAPVAGVLGVSWAVALSGGLLLEAATGSRSKRLACLLGLAALWGAALGLRTVEWTRPLGAPLQVALIQGNIPQELKWAPKHIVPTLRRYIDRTHENWDSDLVIWPEAAVPVFRYQAEKVLANLDEAARKTRTGIILGVPTLQSAPERYFNSLVAIGVGQGQYDKRYLVPFGEYVPLQQWLRGLIGFFDLPMSSFSRGSAEQSVPRAAGVPFAPSICYEIAYARQTLAWLPEAALLVNISNDAWFGRSIGPHQHLQIARQRALETGRYLLRATNTGLTAIIDERGRLRQLASQFEVAVLRGEAQPRQGATPFVRFGEAPVLAGALLVLGIGLLRRRGYEPNRGTLRHA